MKLPTAPAIGSTVITTGVMAASFPITASQVLGFAARFASTFDEYRILGADIILRPAGPNSGSSAFWFDEKSPTTPTQNESLERTAVILPNNSANSKSTRMLRWRARDLLDLEYHPIGTTNVQPVTFKLYTDNVAWAAPIVATQLWVVQAVLHVEFRGLKST